jgi:MFS family permease
MSAVIGGRVGARFWITRFMITWGLLSIGMAFVRGETSFYVMRLLLGVAEAGPFPGVMLYLTYWFSREEQARRVRPRSGAPDNGFVSATSEAIRDFDRAIPYVNYDGT